MNTSMDTTLIKIFKLAALLLSTENVDRNSELIWIEPYKET